jgi:hypothetical protein
VAQLGELEELRGERGDLVEGGNQLLERAQLREGGREGRQEVRGHVERGEGRGVVGTKEEACRDLPYPSPAARHLSPSLLLCRPLPGAGPRHPHSRAARAPRGAQRPQEETNRRTGLAAIHCVERICRAVPCVTPTRTRSPRSGFQSLEQIWLFADCRSEPTSEENPAEHDGAQGRLGHKGTARACCTARKWSRGICLHPHERSPSSARARAARAPRGSQGGNRQVRPGEAVPARGRI